MIAHYSGPLVQSHSGALAANGVYTAAFGPFPSGVELRQSVFHMRPTTDQAGPKSVFLSSVIVPTYTGDTSAAAINSGRALMDGTTFSNLAGVRCAQVLIYNESNWFPFPTRAPIPEGGGVLLSIDNLTATNIRAALSIDIWCPEMNMAR